MTYTFFTKFNQAQVLSTKVIGKLSFDDSFMAYLTSGEWAYFANAYE